MTSSKIDKNDINENLLNSLATIEYVQEQLNGASRLVSIPLELVATVDGQTEFEIDLETFDASNDTVLVMDGRGMLLPNADFTVSGNTITVVDGWDAGDVGGLLILKNVPIGDVGTISGSLIIPGSIPLDRLEEIPSADAAVSSHNTNTSAHNDIRVLINELNTKLTNFLDIDDTTKDQVSEIIALIEDNADDIEAITSGKVNVSDIIDNLTTNVANKPLSAAQGVVINGLIETLQTNINGKAASDHTHSAKDVGALSKVYASHDGAGNVTMTIF